MDGNVHCRWMKIGDQVTVVVACTILWFVPCLSCHWKLEQCSGCVSSNFGIEMGISLNFTQNHTAI